MIKIEIPTAYRGGVKALEEAIERYQPDAVLSIGTGRRGRLHPGGENSCESGGGPDPG